MCEVPSNVILADEFLDVLDGFSIGTNDLTQLTQGVDRDSELVARVYDERDEAVKRLVKQVIEVCLRRRKYIGICGQAPSDYPEFARFVVECGIQTISLNPDTVIKTILDIAPLEKKLEAKKSKNLAGTPGFSFARRSWTRRSFRRKLMVPCPRPQSSTRMSAVSVLRSPARGWRWTWSKC